MFLMNRDPALLTMAPGNVRARNRPIPVRHTHSRFRTFLVLKVEAVAAWGGQLYYVSHPTPVTHFSKLDSPGFCNVPKHHLLEINCSNTGRLWRHFKSNPSQRWSCLTVSARMLPLQGGGLSLMHEESGRWEKSTSICRGKGRGKDCTHCWVGT